MATYSSLIKTMPHLVRLLRWLRVAMIDLRGDFRRFGVLLACLALGVGTIAAVGSVGAVLQSAVQRDARTILGGDLEARLTSRPALPGEVEFFKGLGTTSEVIEFSARAIAGEKTALLSVRAGDANYPLLGSVGLGPDPRGQQPLRDMLSQRDGRFGVLLAPILLERLSLDIGDPLSIGGAPFTVRGTLFALPDQAAQGFQFGLPALMSNAAAAATGASQPGALTRYRYKIVLDELEFDAARAAIRRAFPDAGWIIRSPDDATGTLSRFFELFGRFLVLVGLSSLLVGGVGVSNAVSAYLTERQATIATLRSLGASSGRILVHFLAQVVIITFCGIVIGLVLGAVSTLLALPWLGSLLALALQPAIDVQALAIAAGFGMMVSLAFAFLPLQRAQSLRPAWLFRSGGGLAGESLDWRKLASIRTVGPLLIAVAAIAGLAIFDTRQPWLVFWYAVGALFAFVLLRAAGWAVQSAMRRVPPLPQLPLRLAVSSITRPGAPAPIVILSLGLGLSLLLLIVLVDHNLRGQIEGEIADSAPSFVALNMSQADKAALEVFAAAEPRVERLTLMPVLRASITAVKGVPADELGTLPPEVAGYFRGDTTVSWAHTIPEGSTLTVGEWWPQDYTGEPLLSLSEELRAPLELSLGDTLDMTIVGRPVSARIASFRKLDYARNGLGTAILLSPGLIERAPMRHTGSIVAAAGEESALELDLVRRFPSLIILPVGEALDRAAQMVASLSNAVGIVGALAVASGMLVLAGAIAVGRRQRDADAMVMKILGATRGGVIGAFFAEYALIGTLAAVLGVGLGSVGAALIVTFVLELPFAFDLPLAVAVVLGAVALTVVTGMATTWSSLSVRPARKLRASLA